jgi:hypothetical protein
MWYLDTMEFYSVTKRNEILSFASKWIELENITWMPTWKKDIQLPVCEGEDESSVLRNTEIKTLPPVENW